MILKIIIHISLQILKKSLDSGWTGFFQLKPEEIIKPVKKKNEHRNSGIPFIDGYTNEMRIKEPKKCSK